MVQLEDIAVEKVLDSLSQKQISYLDFQGKAKLKLNGEEVRMGGRSDIIMYKDSAIMMTFKKIGVEGARALVRSDSSWVLYRMENVFEIVKTDEFLAYHKIFMSFNAVQDLLVGNVFVPKDNMIRRYRVNEFYQFEFIQDSNFYQYSINEDFTIHEILIIDTFDREITIKLEDYDDRNFAMRKNIEIKVPNEKDVSLSLKFSKAVFDKSKPIKFEIPSHYSRLL